MNDSKVWSMDSDCQFLKDIHSTDGVKYDNTINVNGNDWSVGLYNLINCRSQVRLFSKGILPNRHWRLKYIKHYFGIKGNTQSILDQLNELCETLLNTPSHEPLDRD